MISVVSTVNAARFTNDSASDTDDAPNALSAAYTAPST
jgi:hypothetical protein